MNDINYRGAGLNAASMLTAIRSANNSPSKRTLLAGATWPLVTLKIGKESIDFHMPSVHKSVTTQSVTKIELSKYGYVFFHTKNKANDFGFFTFRLSSLLRELSARGYIMGATVQKNRLIANALLVLSATCTVGVVVLVTVMSILKPHGV